MEIELLRSRPETGAKSSRLRPFACKWTAEAVKGSLFCFSYVSVVRGARRRGGTRGTTLRAARWRGEQRPPRWFVL